MPLSDAWKRAQALIEARKQHEQSLINRTDTYKSDIERLGAKAEAFDNFLHFLDKNMYGAFLRVYFSKKMAAGDFDEIQELVNLNCHAIINENWGQVIIQGVMLCEPDEYIEAA